MIGKYNMQNILRNINKIKQTQKNKIHQIPVTMICLGDFGQLSPVEDQNLFKPTKGALGIVKKIVEDFIFTDLEQIERMKTD